MLLLPILYNLGYEVCLAKVCGCVSASIAQIRKEEFLFYSALGKQYVNVWNVCSDQTKGLCKLNTKYLSVVQIPKLNLTLRVFGFAHIFGGPFGQL